MSDRFFRGIISGFVAAMAKDVVDLATRYVLRYSQETFWDFNSVIILGKRPPNGWEEFLLAQFGELVLSFTLALVFVYLIEHLWGSERIVLKGAIYGLASWYYLYAATTFFKLPGLLRRPTSTAITHLVSTLAFGIALGLTVDHLSRRERPEAS